MQGLVAHIKRHKRLRQMVSSACIFAKTLLGILAFKATETAMHTSNFSDMAVAGGVIAAILLPIAGLTALSDD